MANPEIPGIRACVFDAYGTLFDVHSAAARCRDDLGGKADAMSDIWRQKQLQYTWLRSLQNDYVDFWEVTGDALDFSMSSLGIDDPALRCSYLENVPANREIIVLWKKQDRLSTNRAEC